jgi:hypothetical protein
VCECHEHLGAVPAITTSAPTSSVLARTAPSTPRLGKAQRLARAQRVPGARPETSASPTRATDATSDTQAALAMRPKHTTQKVSPRPDAAERRPSTTADSSPPAPGVTASRLRSRRVLDATRGSASPNTTRGSDETAGQGQGGDLPAGVHRTPERTVERAVCMHKRRVSLAAGRG